MLEVFNRFLITLIVCSVCTCVNGASISQAVGLNSAKQQNLIEANTETQDVTSNPLWNEASSRIYMEWENIKWVVEAVTNKTFQSIGDLLVSNRAQADPQPEIIQITEKSPTDSHTFSKGQDVEEKNLSKNSTNSTESQSITEDNTRNVCDDEAMGCITWKVLKIVGAAVGAGFLVGLVSPVMFYFTIIVIGCLIYGVIFLSLAVACKADKGRKVAEQYFTACQHIGASSLQNMFSLIPIILTWMGSACLIGWLMWPVL